MDLVYHLNLNPFLPEMHTVSKMSVIKRFYYLSHCLKIVQHNLFIHSLLQQFHHLLVHHKSLLEGRNMPLLNGLSLRVMVAVKLKTILWTNVKRRVLGGQELTKSTPYMIQDSRLLVFLKAVIINSVSRL